jgi:hypothetical protein
MDLLGRWLRFGGAREHRKSLNLHGCWQTWDSWHPRYGIVPAKIGLDVDPLMPPLFQGVGLTFPIP